MTPLIGIDSLAVLRSDVRFAPALCDRVTGCRRVSSREVAEMMPSEWITCYEDEALRAIALAFANLEATVPSCPAWIGRDLLRHLGITPHGWAVCLTTPIGSFPDMKTIHKGPMTAPADD